MAFPPHISILFFCINSLLCYTYLIIPLSLFICHKVQTKYSHFINHLTKSAVPFYNYRGRQRILHIRWLFNQELIKRKTHELQGYLLLQWKIAFSVTCSYHIKNTSQMPCKSRFFLLLSCNRGHQKTAFLFLPVGK